MEKTTKVPKYDFDPILIEICVTVVVASRRGKRRKIVATAVLHRTWNLEHNEVKIEILIFVHLYFHEIVLQLIF